MASSYNEDAYNAIIIRGMRNIGTISTYEVIKCQAMVAIGFDYFRFGVSRHWSHSAPTLFLMETCLEVEKETRTVALDCTRFIYFREQPDDRH